MRRRIRDERRCQHRGSQQAAALGHVKRIADVREPIKAPHPPDRDTDTDKPYDDAPDGQPKSQPLLDHRYRLAAFDTGDWDVVVITDLVCGVKRDSTSPSAAHPSEAPAAPTYIENILNKRDLKQSQIIDYKV